MSLILVVEFVRIHSLNLITIFRINIQHSNKENHKATPWTTKTNFSVLIYRT